MSDFWNAEFEERHDLGERSPKVFVIDLSNEQSATPVPLTGAERELALSKTCPLCGEIYQSHGAPDPKTAHRRKRHPGWTGIDEDSPLLDGGPYPGERA